MCIQRLLIVRYCFRPQGGRILLRTVCQNGRRDGSHCKPRVLSQEPPLRLVQDILLLLLDHQHEHPGGLLVPGHLPVHRQVHEVGGSVRTDFAGLAAKVRRGPASVTHFGKILAVSWKFLV